MAEFDRSAGKEAPILNWWPKPKKLTAGLRKKLKDPRKSFATIRLGEKWRNTLNAGDRVALSISNNPAKMRVVGYAEVISVWIEVISELSERTLSLNIGAKARMQVLKDMRKAYAPNMVNRTDLVSVIKLRPCK